MRPAVAGLRVDAAMCGPRICSPSQAETPWSRPHPGDALHLGQQGDAETALLPRTEAENGLPTEGTTVITDQEASLESPK